MYLSYFQILRMECVYFKYFITEESAISLAIRLPYCSLIKIIQTALIQGLSPLCSEQAALL